MSADDISTEAPRVGLLRWNARFRLFWSARAISFVGDGTATIALVLYVKQREGSGFAVAGLLLASSVPRLLGPVAGTLADRLRARPLMVSCDLGQAAIYSLIATVRPSLWLLLPLVACAATLATIFRPAGSGLVPRLVAAENLLEANSWVGLALNLQVVGGPPLGAVAFEFLGIRGALALNAATFVVSAAFLSRLKLLPAEDVSRDLHVTFLMDLREGLSFVFGNRLLRIVVITLFGSVLFAAVDNVALVFLTRDSLHASSVGYGAVAAVFGVGMVAAALILTRSKRSGSSALSIYVGGLLLNGLGTLATGLATGLPLAAVAQAAAGAGNGAENIGVDTVIQQHTPVPFVGRAFGVVGTAAVLGVSLATLLGGTLVELTSPRTTFVAAGIGVLVTALPAALLVRDRGEGRRATQG